MNNNTSSSDIKVDAISSLSTAGIKKEAGVDIEITRLIKLFKCYAITEKKVLDLVCVAFVLEALILTEKMRDFRLTDLEKKEVENIAIELYQSIEEMRNEMEGDIGICKAADKIIEKQLSPMLLYPASQRSLEFEEKKTLWSWSSFDTDEAKIVTAKAITLFSPISSLGQEALDRVIKSDSLYRDLAAAEKQIKELAKSSANKEIEGGEAIPDPGHMRRIFTCIDRNDEDEFLDEFGFLYSYGIFDIFMNHKVDNYLRIREELGCPLIVSESTSSGW